jgi:hypothetical protein
MLLPAAAGAAAGAGAASKSGVSKATAVDAELWEESDE